MKIDLKKKFEEQYPLVKGKVILKKCNCCSKIYPALFNLIEETKLIDIVQHRDIILIYCQCECGSTITYLANEILGFGEIYKLLYVSFKSELYNSHAIKKIAVDSQLRNAKLGISGQLILAEDVIIQLLEGEKDQVNLLFEKIAYHPAHHSITVLAKGYFAERTMPGHFMKFIAVNNPNHFMLNKVLEWKRYLSHSPKEDSKSSILEKVLSELDEVIKQVGRVIA
ncbi:MAG: hypothetical protein OHK0056_18450 [Bacteriovoracaceae bacterium]